jgi:small GTP-binding protein
MNEPESVKVVLLGESGVGKTSIINQFITNKFNPRISTSVSAQFISKTINFPEFEKSIKFDIWDTVGQEKYRSLTKIFYKDARVILLVYDITKEISFSALKDYWYKEVINTVDDDPLLVLVANKTDLYLKQTVTNNVGKEYAEQIKAMFQTTSALNSQGINTLFENIGKKIIMPDYDYRNTDNKALHDFSKKRHIEKKIAKIKLDKKNINNPQEKQKRCC